jgi:hypothetical protein
MPEPPRVPRSEASTLRRQRKAGHVLFRNTQPAVVARMLMASASLVAPIAEVCHVPAVHLTAWATCCGVGRC